MSAHRSKLYGRLLGGVAAISLLTAFGAHAEDLTQFDIAPQPLSSALNEFATQSKMAVLFTPDLTGARVSAGLSKTAEPETALAMMLQGTGLSWKRNGDTFIIMSASDPQSGSAAGDGADGTVQALIVTAQKREEAIQDVPIAISAFTEKSLQEQKIEGGFDLLKAIPNVTFSKNNFTSYNFSIRGIGTKAVSATTDPGVAVSFNNVTLLQNRLFEQEYFDVERVEVLRGPQGTLYGRNATAGVINVISAKPNLHEFDGWIKGEVGNYQTKRLSAMVNMPLVEDKLAIRIAGALTDRQGYDFNAGTDHAVNGRDLWSARVTLAFNPTESIRSNLVWERFNEDDNRSRTGKQLCHRDPGPTQIGTGPNAVTTQWHDPNYERPDGINFFDVMTPALFSQGCKPGSLYDDSAFGTPNGLALPFVFAALFFGADCGTTCSDFYPLGIDPATGRPTTLIQLRDPYGGMMQSRDLRTIQSFRDPHYVAKADVVELNIDVDLTPDLTFSSQTAYDKDQVYSFQDYNRFNTVPIFTDTSQLLDPVAYNNGNTTVASSFVNLAPGGQFCDPQLGCSNTLAGFDISQAKSSQFTQELRLQSDFKGPINFSVGANYTRFNVLVDYYVFYNMITAFSLMKPLNFWDNWRDVTGAPPPSREMMLTTCPTTVQGFLSGYVENPPIAQDAPGASCIYIDPNPIESLNGEGHNYFRSKNPYRLHSSAMFGELYWQASDNLKITAGLRYNDDRKTFTPVPSQILLANAPTLGGTVNRGYPALPDIKQHWGEWTGRLGVDWKPNLGFTDQTMVYAFYSRGYKGGGANPPIPGFGTETIAEWLGIPPGAYPPFDVAPLKLTGVDYGPTFKPEFVNAFEVGTKNTLLGGGLTLNSDVFFYDYKDYQVSQIKDRTAVNENFDAKIWGLEFETRFAPSRDFQLITNLGYLDTKIGDGMESIDIMDRTAGDPNFVVVKPWVQLPSNCIVPVPVVQNFLLDNGGSTSGYWGLCGGVAILGLGTGHQVVDPATGQFYDPLYYNGQNGTVNTHGGAGIAKDLSGNELPNSPHWTMNIGAQYGHDILDGSWRATVRADVYWQSQSWTRVYNDNPYDKLHGWYNMNLSLWFERPEDDLKIELYAKNILDKTPITDAFLNSDDTALTTNVFVLDPRLIGVSIHKGF